MDTGFNCNALHSRALRLPWACAWCTPRRVSARRRISWKKYNLFKNEKRQKNLRARWQLTVLRKLWKTINMKCIVMVIFSYILWDGWGGIYCILGRGGTWDLLFFVFVFFCLQTMFLVAMENVLKRNCDIWWDFFVFFLPPKCLCLKGTACNVPQCGKLTETRMRHWPRGERGREAVQCQVM